jgi:geranylgeranyl reductase family protein
LYDLIVVGGGPAGASCAWKAASIGLDVVLIEKAHHPRHKLCGGALSPRTKDIIDFDLTPAIDREGHAVKVISSEGTIVTAVRDDFSGYLIKRPVFDSYILKMAKDSGVQVVEGTQVVSVEQLRKGVRALVRGDSFKGHLIVGADGVNSTVARSLNLKNKWSPNEFTLCIAADVSVDPSQIQLKMSLNGSKENTAIEMYLGVVDWGFGWCFPKSDEISIGIGARMDKVSDLRPFWKAFKIKLAEEKGFDLGNIESHSHRIPYSKPDGVYSGRRTMLVGDAAGLVSPVISEGIYYAMKSGIIAAQVASDIVRNKDPLLVRTFDERVQKEIGNELRIAKSISNMLYRSRNNAELICKMARDDDVLRNSIIDLIIGLKPYATVRRDILRRLVRFHPLKALRLGIGV